MDDAIKSVRRKVDAIFAELVGDRAKRLDGSVMAEPAMSAVGTALGEQYGEKAHDIAFHMADWNSDAAFIVAVHLFPERFTLPTKLPRVSGCSWSTRQTTSVPRVASPDITCGRAFPKTVP